MDQYKIISRTKEYLKYLGNIPDAIEALQVEIGEKQELMAMDPAARIAHMGNSGGRSSCPGSCVETEAARNERLQADIDSLKQQIVDYRQEYDAFIEIAMRNKMLGSCKTTKGWEALSLRYFRRFSMVDIGRQMGGYSSGAVREWMRPVLLSVGSIVKGWQDGSLYYYEDGTYAAMTQRQIKEQREIEAYHARLEAEGVWKLT